MTIETTPDVEFAQLEAELNNGTEAVEASTEEAPIEQAEEENAQLEQKEEPFPKKAENAISRRDKKINKLQAERNALLAELEQLRSSTQSKGVDTPPSEDDFDTFGEFLKATARYEAKQELIKDKEGQLKTQEASYQEQWIAERSAAVEEKALNYIQTVPDFKQTVEEFADIVDTFPPQLEQVFLEADDAPLAFYTLAKEGKLEQLASMSPFAVAMEIGRAQERGIALINKKPVSKAPTPITPNRGTTKVAETDPSKMSYEQLLAALPNL